MCARQQQEEYLQIIETPVGEKWERRRMGSRKKLFLISVQASAHIQEGQPVPNIIDLNKTICGGDNNNMET